ncbi:sodium-independent sulfate anion transporter isoform X2 [Drosophila guanche]|uniref:Blast:Sodium-independent sulfate anion transporter n=1 Tax=Drosophila guanche TaxID=7266 RepID=A0A3B0JF47_DROGU|nr:sodium-independent sulfate anion transporter isoform X2 [Drosophila guanche]SPP81004.1 blast:Sodium-independent sulfate anion transporter [Drosophila guanche]
MSIVKKLSFDANCEEKEKYTLQNGDDCYDQANGHTVDVEGKYTKAKQAHWLLRRIYILSWIRSYDRERAFADLIAGITLGLTIIPQSIAYAALAGLSSEYGLYSAFIGSIIYVFFGTIPQVSIGPTSLMAILTLQFCADKPVQVVIVLAFLAGLVELAMGVFQLGFIVSFIPAPVTKAFTSGTAVIVVFAQIKNLLGVRVKGFPSIGEFFGSIRPSDAAMGIFCLVVLLSLRLLSQVKFKQDSPMTRRLKKVLWYISISRNALVVFFTGLLVFIWVKKSSLEAVPFALSSKVSSAMPSIKLPPFAFEYQNRTYVFTDILHELGSGIVVVPIVAVLANVAIAKAFVKDGNLDASQEMLTLGLCNIAGSFFSAMPTCGAFTRSAVSQASGVRTPMAGIYTGLIVLSALSILTPYFQYIPKASLSAVLIAAVIFMIDLAPVKELWQTNKKDFFSWVGSFIICLVAGVELGLLFGIVLSMVFILLRLGNPKIEVSLKQEESLTYVHVVPQSDIYYTGVDTLRGELRGASSLYRHDFPVVLDCSRFMQFDATFTEMLTAVSKEMAENDVLLILQNMSLKVQQMLPVIGNVRFCQEDSQLISHLQQEKESGQQLDAKL